MDFVFFGGHFEFFGQMVRDLEPEISGVWESRKSLGRSNRLPSVKRHNITDTSEDFLVADLAPADRKVQNGSKRKKISPINIKVNDHYSKNVFLRISARALIENFGAKDGRGRGGAYLIFRPRGRALIRGRTLIRGNTVL